MDNLDYTRLDIYDAFNEGVIDIDEAEYLLDITEAANASDSESNEDDEKAAKKKALKKKIAIAAGVAAGVGGAIGIGKAIADSKNIDKQIGKLEKKAKDLDAFQTNLIQHSGKKSVETVERIANRNKEKMDKIDDELTELRKKKAEAAITLAQKQKAEALAGIAADRASGVNIRGKQSKFAGLSKAEKQRLMRLKLDEKKDEIYARKNKRMAAESGFAQRVKAYSDKKKADRARAELYDSISKPSSKDAEHMDKAASDRVNAIIAARRAGIIKKK
jgi:flagellar basal body-associated protein FliL